MTTRTRLARRLRRDATDVERTLWRELRQRLRPWSFRRQHPIGNAIVDFACPATRRVIELDGGQHSPEADAARTQEIARHGYRVIRFWNNGVTANLDGVLETIRKSLITLSALQGGEGRERGDGEAI